MENKSNEQNLNNIDYNEFAKKIKMKSPIHKTNLDSGPNFVLGMHVITLENATKEIYEKYADLSDLNDSTILCFENRHLMEVLQILYGTLIFLGSRKDIDADTINKVLEEIISIAKTQTYGSFRYRITKIVNKYIANAIKHYKNINENIYNNIINLFFYVWFIPYGKIDELSEAAVKLYNERARKKGDNKSDESDG